MGERVTKPEDYPSELRVEVELSTEYWDYVLGPRWLDVRRRAITLSGGRCEICGRTGWRERDPLSCHHRHYKKPLGAEIWPDDLQVVCARCHPVADQARDRAKFLQGLETFAKKCWDGKGLKRPSPAEIEGVFMRWLAKKQLEASQSAKVDERGKARANPGNRATDTTNRAIS